MLKDVNRFIQKMNEKEKNKSADETQNIIKEILDYNRQVQKAFALTSKIKKKQNQNEHVKKVLQKE